jgi:uncharacterized protein (DUF1810 family)
MEKNGPKVDPLELILAAQEGTLFDNDFSTYQDALSELRHGAKRTCWMWYIWPSLTGVRAHRMPFMILSFADHIAYLKHNVLGPRLIQCTKIAISQLEKSITKECLFDGSLDSIKFHESCTAFAVAAMASNDQKAALVFAKAFAFYGGRLNAKVVQVLQSNEHCVVDVYLEQVEALIRPRKIPQTKQNQAPLFSHASAPVEFPSDEEH